MSIHSAHASSSTHRRLHDLLDGSANWLAALQTDACMATLCMPQDRPSVQARKTATAAPHLLRSDNHQHHCCTNTDTADDYKRMWPVQPKRFEATLDTLHKRPIQSTKGQKVFPRATLTCRWHGASPTRMCRQQSASAKRATQNLPAHRSLRPEMHCTGMQALRMMPISSPLSLPRASNSHDGCQRSPTLHVGACSCQETAISQLSLQLSAVVTPLQLSLLQMSITQAAAGPLFV